MWDRRRQKTHSGLGGKKNKRAERFFVVAVGFERRKKGRRRRKGTERGEEGKRSTVDGKRDEKGEERERRWLFLMAKAN